MLRRIVLRLIANAAAVVVVANVVGFCLARAGEASCLTGGAEQITAILFAGILLTILNSFVRPVLKLISLPAIFLTLGLFTLVVNIAIVWLFAWFLPVLGFTLILPAGKSQLAVFALSALVLSLFNFFTHWLLKR